ncbi:MAG: sigma-70 family RNA polymerase sigma factor [Pirellulaceae bacterium]|nr:sigma-70 family RNA polymerase sigma factor [Pirellulaceae bacterium]
MPADQELIRLVREGDSGAVAELYERYAPVVWRYVFARMRRDTHAGQDVLSETFLAAIRALRDGATAENVTGWLTGIARHKIADWYRRREKSATTEAEPGTQDTSSANSVVADVLDALPAEERVILEWKYVDRCTVREIAERLGRTEKGVEALLYRARNAFRTAYETALE